MSALTIVGIFIYMLPSIIAIVRYDRVGRSRFINILVSNYLLGWLIVPWFIALFLACKKSKQEEADGTAQS